MKVIIQIPCYNEEATLARTLSFLPRKLPGVDCVEWLVIDDGCLDKTVEVARAGGVDHIVRHPINRGLARAFITGLQACLDRGADIIVNTDADNQYCADDIPQLIEPILSHEAEIVIGTRPTTLIAHFSPLKKFLQKLGSAVVRLASKTDVQDAPSGFRAISREAAMLVNVFNKYTYTLETIIQAGMKGVAVKSVDIRTNEDARPSRLVKSIRSYVWRSSLTILRILMTYAPFRFFAIPGVVCSLAGFALGVRFLVAQMIDPTRMHIQSVILCALLLGVGFFLIVIGLVADLIAANRQLLEKIDWRLQRVENQLRKGSQ